MSSALLSFAFNLCWSWSDDDDKKVFSSTIFDFAFLSTSDHSQQLPLIGISFISRNVAGDLLRAFRTFLLPKRAFIVEEFYIIGCAWQNWISYQIELSKRCPSRALLHLRWIRKRKEFAAGEALHRMHQLVHDAQREGSPIDSLRKGDSTLRIQSRTAPSYLPANFDYPQHTGRIFAERCVVRPIVHQ